MSNTKQLEGKARCKASEEKITESLLGADRQKMKSWCPSYDISSLKYMVRDATCITWKIKRRH